MKDASPEPSNPQGWSDPFGASISVPDRNVLDAVSFQFISNMGLMVMQDLLKTQALDKERAHQEKIQERNLEQQKLLHKAQTEALQNKHSIDLLKAQHEAELLKALMQQHSAQSQSHPPRSNPVNPYRGARTVGDIEEIMMQQPVSPQREQALQELAKYPESMPIAQLPSSTTRRLAGR